MLVKQNWQWLQKPVNPLVTIERAGRVCYKSEDKITEDSAAKFVKMLIKSGHETVIEHVTASVLIETNRGVTHELVRHRLFSFSQTSTRYVNYNKREMQFIEPVWWEDWTKGMRKDFLFSCKNSEMRYNSLIKAGARPEQAREILPNALQTEIVGTANMREWRHTFKLRCSKAAHPQIRHLFLDILAGFHECIPVIFDDLAKEYLK